MIKTVKTMIESAESLGWDCNRAGEALIFSKGASVIRMYREDYGATLVFSDHVANKSWSETYTEEELAQEVAAVTSTVGVTRRGGLASSNAQKLASSFERTTPGHKWRWWSPVKNKAENEESKAENEEWGKSPSQDVAGVTKSPAVTGDPVRKAARGELTVMPSNSYQPTSMNAANAGAPAAPAAPTSQAAVNNTNTTK